MLTPPRYLWFDVSSKWIYTTTEDAISNLIKIFNGKKPCYISSYIFPTQNSIIFDRIVYDLDHPTDLNIAYKATLNLMEFCEEYSIPYIIVFSGKHGFHFYEFFKPCNNIDKFKLLGIQHEQLRYCGIGLRDKHGNPVDNGLLPAIRSQTLGRFRQVFRIPNTLYVKKGEKSNRYCRVLFPREFKKGIDHILHISKQKGEIPSIPQSTFNFREFYEILSIENEVPRIHRSINVSITNSSNSIPTLNVILPVCLQKRIVTPNPSHLIRLETTAYLKFLGYSNESIINFYETLQWDDYNRGKTTYQVNSIFPRLPDCKKLKMECGCLDCKSCLLQRKKQLVI